MLHLLSRVTSGLILTYVILLTGYVLLRGLPAEAPWWLDLADTFALYLFVPALPVLLLGLLTFSRPIQLLCVVPIALFALLYRGQFLPLTPDSTAKEISFTVITHNVEAGNPDPLRVARVIAETNADVVALQELTPEIAQVLTARLGDRYQYRALLPRADYSGAGVYSRFPIRSAESFTAGHLAQHLALDVKGQNVHFFNAHPLPPEIKGLDRGSFPPYVIRGFDTKAQRDQVSAIMERIDAVEGPLVLTGDFNLTEQTRLYRGITRHLTDAYREVGRGFGHTFPILDTAPRLPAVLRIDYIFHSRELVGLEARVGDPTGSNHLPVVARLGLRSSDNR